MNKIWLLLLLASPAWAVVNLNTATVAELDSLKGIGPGRAAAIIKYRTEHGRFNQLHELKNVSGIGDKTFEKLKSDITLTEPTQLSPTKRSE